MILLHFLYIGVGVFAGIYVGAIPGLSVTMATALLISTTYSWDVNSAMALMMGVYVGGVYGGSRSAILLNIPGAPAAVATTFDGYPLAKRGEAGHAIATSTIMSVVGGMVGLVVLYLGAPIVSDMALRFGPKDYFLFTLMGLMLVGSLSGSSLPKGLFAAALGLMLGVVGTDGITGIGRFVFGNVQLRGGIEYISVMIGLFGIGEALYQLIHREQPIVRQQVGKIRPPMRKLLKYLPLSIRSSLIGTFVGALPGAGGDIAALMAYDLAKRTVRKPEVPFGEGAYEGVVAPESANNAAIGGALIPLLTLGIPGDSVTAIFIGALSIHGIRAGPMVMVNHPDLFPTLSLFLLVANIFLLFLGMTGIKVLTKLTEVPRSILIPLILIISVIGSYAVSNSLSGIAWAMASGVVGYFMKYYGYPVGPTVLGLILGPTIEANFRRAIMSAGSLGGMFADIVTNPVSLVLTVLLLLMIISQVAMKRKSSS